MPLLILKTTTDVPSGKRTKVLTAVSKLISEVTGKPESFVMVTMERVDGCFSGKECPLAFADIRGIGGFSKNVNTKLSKGLCDLLKSELSIPSDRVYCNFTNVPADSWGWNGGVFG